jgi:hypothetical protein
VRGVGYEDGRWCKQCTGWPRVRLQWYVVLADIRGQKAKCIAFGYRRVLATVVSQAKREPESVEGNDDRGGGRRRERKA